MIMPILAVKDLEASITFYKHKLGFTHDFTMPGPDGKPNFAIVNLGDSAMIGLQLDARTEQRGNGVVFMVYLPDGIDIDQLYADVQARSAKIDTPIKTEYWGDRLFSLHDPDGYYVSLTKTVKQVSPEDIIRAGAQD